MKTGTRVATVFGGVFLLLPMALTGGALWGQAFMEAGTPIGMEGGPAAPSAADSALYADGTRAIDEGRWADAAAIFARVADQHGEHADGALYWKAYAENKQGNSQQALATCGELRRGYKKSRWKDECSALEIGIHARHGKPVTPRPGESDDVQLLALNAMMRDDEPHALAEIEAIIKGESGQKTKGNAIFVLAQSRSPQAEELLSRIAQGRLKPAQSSSVLQARARELLLDKRSTPMVATGRANRMLTVDVVVTDKQGGHVRGLGPGEFSLFDNKQPHSIARLREVNSGKIDMPVEAIVLVDAINAPFEANANERQWLAAFAAENGGHLALPTSLIIMTDDGVKMQNHPTQDGKVLMDYMDRTSSGVRVIQRQDAMDRERLSLNALEFIATDLSKRPGRKLLIWLAAGWPLMSDESWKGTTRERLWILNTVAGLSAALRDARITIYSINPFGVGHGNTFYKRFLQYPNSLNETDYGDLFLQVLAIQSGGTVQYGSNDIANQIDRCIADGSSFYELSFEVPPSATPNEAHSIEVRMNRPDLVARTRTGYYAQP